MTVGADHRIALDQAPVTQAEPLALQFEAFVDAIRNGSRPKVSGESAARTLEVALAIADKIKEHASVVANSLAAGWKP